MRRVIDWPPLDTSSRDESLGRISWKGPPAPNAAIRLSHCVCDPIKVFNVVAVDDFNCGAMENKGLNIFNSSCVLCDAASSTDDNYRIAESCARSHCTKV